MSEVAELIELPPQETALQVYQQPNGLDPYIERIRIEVMGHVPDLTTRKGREAIAGLAFKVRKAKTKLDSLGKDLVDGLKEIPKKIDAERKRARETLDALADEVRRPLTEWEAAEDARLARHNQNVMKLAQYAANANPQLESEVLRNMLAAVRAVVVNESWEEFEAEAHRAKEKALEALQAALTARERYEAEQVELAELRRKQAEQEQKDREAEIARKAAEQARADAEAKAQAERDAAAKREADAKAAQTKAEQDAEDAIERQRQAEARAEAERLAAEQRANNAAEAARLAEIERQRQEQERQAAELRRREADRAHKAKINSAAVAALVAGGLTAEAAKLAITLIAKGKVPSVKVNY